MYPIRERDEPGDTLRIHTLVQVQENPPKATVDMWCKAIPSMRNAFDHPPETENFS